MGLAFRQHLGYRVEEISQLNVKLNQLISRRKKEELLFFFVNHLKLNIFGFEIVGETKIKMTF